MFIFMRINRCLVEKKNSVCEGEDGVAFTLREGGIRCDINNLRHFRHLFTFPLMTTTVSLVRFLSIANSPSDSTVIFIAKRGEPVRI